jgi:hypothetical protein
MGRFVTLVLVLAAFAVPAALAKDHPSPQNTKNAAHLCKAQRTSMGLKDFRSLWGTKNGRNAFGNCVALTAQQQQENVQSAEEQCRAERADDRDAFAQKYHSFGKCVSQTAKAESQADQQATLNAAKACKAERAHDASAFHDRYGTKRNAFGKCVSAKVKQR